MKLKQSSIDTPTYKLIIPSHLELSKRFLRGLSIKEIQQLFWFFFLLILCFSCQPTPRDKSYQEENKKKLDSTLTQQLNLAFQKDSIKGFSVAVVNENGIVYEHGFGHTDIDNTQDYSAQTIQALASISKTFIGVALMKAAEMNLLNLEDPINQYLPFKVVNPQHPNEEILIKHLAYHTSSIIDQEDIYFNQYFFEDSIIIDNDRESYYGIFRKSSEKVSLEEYLREAFDEKSDYEALPFSDNQPGSVRDYSNIGADLCAYIIGNAAKMDFRDFTKKYITEPLGMHTSGWGPGRTERSLQSRLFVHPELMLNRYEVSNYPSGWFISSSHELGLFLAELINGYNGQGTLLSKETYQQLFEKQAYDDKFYGCFLEYRDDWMGLSDSIIGHNGSEFGVFTGMYFNPERNSGKIILSNTDTDFFDEELIWGEIRAIWQALIDYEEALFTVEE